MSETRIPHVEFGEESFWPFMGETYPASTIMRPFEDFQEWMLKQGFKVEKVTPWPESGVYWSEPHEEVFEVFPDFMESRNYRYDLFDYENDDWRDVLPLVLMTKTGVVID